MISLYTNEKCSNDKYNQIVEYLKQDNSYWLNNNKWDFTEKCFAGNRIGGARYLDFTEIKSEIVKNELKYYVLFNYKENKLKIKYILNTSCRFKDLGSFLDKYYHGVSIYSILNKNNLMTKWSNYLFNVAKLTNTTNLSLGTDSLSRIYDFLDRYYDEREETAKDTWNANNIKGARIPATFRTAQLDFTEIPKYYREEIKRYFLTIITKKSWTNCSSYLVYLKYFFDKFYANEYKDGFLENINRADIEKYIYWVNTDHKDKNATYKSKYISYIRTILEYMQIAEYNKAPKKEICRLMYQDDIPRRELHKDEVKKAKFIPEPIIQQIDDNINDLDTPELIPIYILLRETGWRGTDILNLRYYNCLEQIWNSKEEKYNYYLCGEITKTGIAELKIPIRDYVADVVTKCIEEARKLSTEENNPNKYLFNIYEGKFKGRPIGRYPITESIRNLITSKDIKDVNGNYYHFILHSLRHTRAKEYTEQGVGISVIQQLLGHQSLQMTAHYAAVTENTLYEKWKATEKLDLFKVNIETKAIEAVDLSGDSNENIIRYEYVRQNLDAVTVPFGICFKSEKIACKKQINHCLACVDFCTTEKNIPEYKAEIKRVQEQIKISEQHGRISWIAKNTEYLELLEMLLKKIEQEKIVHKNGNSREEQN